MPKTTKQLTNTEVKLAKPRDKEYSLADSRGLYLRIKPNGSKLGCSITPDRLPKREPILAWETTPTFH